MSNIDTEIFQAAELCLAEGMIHEKEMSLYLAAAQYLLIRSEVKNVPEQNLVADEVSLARARLAKAEKQMDYNKAREDYLKAQQNLNKQKQLVSFLASRIKQKG